MNQDIRNAICDMGHDEAVVFDGPDFDEAIIGVTDEGRVIYDYDAMVHQLQTQQNISQIDAEDFIGYNTIRAIPYAGEKAPIIMYPIAPFFPIEDATAPDNLALDLLQKLLELYQENGDITLAKAMDLANQQCKKTCPRCGNKLLPSTIQGYTWQCLQCDEDFYDIEIIGGNDA